MGSLTVELQAALPREPVDAFPELDTAGFSPEQMRLLEKLRTEYAKHPRSFDSAVMAYTDGVKEPWCADFVSWSMREIGRPLVNPHSGSWRVPGVYTLREYYQSADMWRSAGEYTPKFGDVAVYTSTPEKSHTNFVLRVNPVDKTMLTLGGNEGGHMRLSVRSYVPPAET